MGAASLGPVLGLMANALVFGLSWWPFREMQSLGLHPLWATTLMYGLSFVFISLLRPQWFRSLRQHPQLWWLFVGSGLTNFGFNWAVTQGDVVRVVLLFYTMPAWSVLFAWWLLDEKPDRMALARLSLALLGVALILKSPDTPWPLPSSAMDYLALLGGASFALNNAMLRKLAFLPESDRMGAMFGGGMCITALAAAALLPSGLVSLPTDTSWWPFALGLALCLLFSNLSLQYGAARLPANTTALVMLSEIVFATASSVMMGASELNVRKIAGGLLIVFAAILATMQDANKESA
jgi:drug/metabolite transporter (DMT)-like permease